MTLWTFLCLFALGWFDVSNSIKPNVMFLMVDDLRPAVGIYGDDLAITPNLDLLGSQSVVFKNAFAQYALCGPSRVSILTSLKPHSFGVFDMSVIWRDIPGRNYSTLPQVLQANGYETVPFGKVFHHNYSIDLEHSWTQKFEPILTDRPPNPKAFCKKHGFKAMVCPVDPEEMELRNHRLIDRSNLQWAKQYLSARSMMLNPKPLFLAFGFNRPHIPWLIPEEFVTLFPLDKIPSVHNASRFASAPKFAFTDYKRFRLSGDFKTFRLDNPMGPLNDDFRKLVTQYYYSSVTYVDNMIGQLLETLDGLGLLDTTIINLISDHGFSLGENGELSKMSHFQTATRVPWMIYDPIHTHASLRGYQVKLPHEAKVTQVPLKSVEDPVELLDVFPTLTALLGLEPVEECSSLTDEIPCTEGTSQAHLITDLEALHSARSSPRAFYHYPRTQLDHLECGVHLMGHLATMGYSIRTQEYRYTEWVEWNNEKKEPKWDRVIGQELYEHMWHGHEDHNLAGETRLGNIMTNLSHQLRESFLSAA